MSIVIKYYVVWIGRVPGIYMTWDQCSMQTRGYSNAKYRAFDSLTEATAAYKLGYEKFESKESKSDSNRPTYGLAVDAAFSSKTKLMEYQGVDIRTGQVVFHQGPFSGATNNIGEYLALVHALSLLTQKNINVPIYSDSRTAMAWVREKKHNSNIETDPSTKIGDMLIRAEKWLTNNDYKLEVIKWDTKVLGEIPADFGRK